MSGFEELLERLEQLIAEVEAYEEPARTQVFELLDGFDSLHRFALLGLAEALGPEAVVRARSRPSVRWLLDAYGVGVDERAAADAALDEVRPYVRSHGGSVDVLAAEAGVVRVRLSGACSGCTASAVTLREGVERALRDGLRSFRALEVEEDEAPAHPPPGPTLLQIRPRS